MPTRLKRYDEPGHVHFWTISCCHRLSFFWNDRIKQTAIAGLIDRPEQWRWSSYRYYELNDRSVLAMDWDGQWPIVW